MKEPVWLDLPSVHLLHDRQLELFGGRRGFRDEEGVERALNEPVDAWVMEQADDLESLAAIYLCAITRERGYKDGNRRTALGAMLAFLTVNGRQLRAPQDELYALVTSAADREVDAGQVAGWLRRHARPARR